MNARILAFVVCIEAIISLFLRGGIPLRAYVLNGWSV